jgi:2,4-dienoyl-CoA reductase-like NADH-dependent reductase (Old Yellow Enzyme family)
MIETVRAVRRAVGADKVVSVKLNSSDFQKGGFSFEDCLKVVAMLDMETVDLLEISGGNYEQPRMMGQDGLEPVFETGVRESTRAREAYFMAYAEEVLKSARTPVMVTGGFRSRTAMEEAVDSGVAMVGIGRPLCVEPDACNLLRREQIEALPAFEAGLRLGSGYFGPTSSNDVIKAANALSAMAFYYRNIIRMADGKPTQSSMNLLFALIKHQLQEAADAKAM